MHDNNDEMLDIRDYLEILSRRWRVIAVSALALAVLAAIAAFLTTGLYAAEVEVMLDLPSDNESVSSEFAAFERQPLILRSLPVAERVAGDLRLPDSPENLWHLVNSVETETRSPNILVVRSSHESRELAQALPSAFLEHYLDHQNERLNERQEAQEREWRASREALNRERELILERLGELHAAAPATVGEEVQRALERDSLLARLRALETELIRIESPTTQPQGSAEGATFVVRDLTIRATHVSPPTSASTDPFVLSALRNSLLGLLLGLTLGTILAITREWHQRRLVRERDARRIVGAPVLGIVRGQDSNELALSGHEEDYRSLRAMLRTRLYGSPAADDPDVGPISLLVVSPDDRRVAAEMAANIAVAFARAGSEVLLVDLGPTTTGSSCYFPGVSTTRPGLQDVLVGRADLDEAAAETNVAGLRLLVPGETHDPAVDPISTNRIRRFLNGQAADLVVLDAPALTDHGDALECAPVVTGVLLAAEWDSTRLGALEDAATRLSEASAYLCGVAMRMVTRGGGVESP